MKLWQLFCVLACLLACLLALMFLTVYGHAAWPFYAAEGLVLVILGYLVYFYQKVIKPMHTIGSGMDLLAGQDFSSRLNRVGQVEADRLVSLFNKMMSSLKEERLRVQEQSRFLDLLISASPMAVVMLDFDGRVQLLNEAAMKALETTADAVGKTMEELRSPLAQAVAQMGEGDTRMVSLSDAKIYRCSRLSFPDRGFAHPFFLMELLTEEVMRIEKESYGKVIRMISHEVNNTVAGVVSALDVVSGELDGCGPSGDLREMMRVSGERCLGMSRFVTRFANMVKIPKPDRRPADLNEVVAACKRFMEALCSRHDIRLELSLCPGSAVVNLDTPLFEQVLVNVVKNAVESIGERGLITVATRVLPAGGVELEVSDNGRGISPEAESKLFTPFFSTKPGGQGIGLMLIREVLVGHGCAFSLRTGSDGLTRFKVRF